MSNQCALSARMQALADLVDQDTILADIGTDHGYLPIYLVQRGICARAYAMDIRKGPLQRAKDHIEAAGLTGQIETRLSDGLDALLAGEANRILIAGMGGGLVIQILTKGRPLITEECQLILQPQSELTEVRRYLSQEGYHFLEENMVKEDGKYYPMMKVLPGKQKEILTRVELTYGKLLLDQKHPVLLDYLKKEKKQLQAVSQRLEGVSDTSRIAQRRHEIEQALKLNTEAQNRILDH